MLPKVIIVLIATYLEVHDALNFSVVNKLNDSSINRKKILDNNKINPSNVINIIKNCLIKGVNYDRLLLSLSNATQFLNTEKCQTLSVISKDYVYYMINHQFCCCDWESKQCIIPKNYQVYSHFKNKFKNPSSRCEEKIFIKCRNNTNQKFIKALIDNADDILWYSYDLYDFNELIISIFSKLTDFTILDSLCEKFFGSPLMLKKFFKIICDNYNYYEILEYILNNNKNKFNIIVPIIETENKIGKIMWKQYCTSFEKSIKKRIENKLFIK